MAESITLTGLKETAAKLKALDAKVQKTIVRRATRAGAKVVLAAARADAPAMTGVTRANVKIRAGGTSKGVYRLTVGVGAKDFAGPAFYAAFVLYGHAVGSRRLGGARRKVPANNWLERALDDTAVAATDTVVDALLSGVEAEANTNG